MLAGASQSFPLNYFSIWNPHSSALSPSGSNSPTHTQDQTSCKRQMPSLHPSLRNRLAYSKLPPPVTPTQRATSNPRKDSNHPSHSTRPCSHFDPRNPGSPSQSIISNESQQLRTRLQSSCQLTEQNRMATSSQRLIQQPMDLDSGTTHSRQTRN